MMRPQITRLRSSQNMRQSIRTSLNQLQLAVLQNGGRCLLHGPQLGIFMGLTLEKKIHVLDTVRTEFKTERNEKR